MEDYGLVVRRGEIVYFCLKENSQYLVLGLSFKMMSRLSLTRAPTIDLEELKNKHTETNNTIIEIKNTLEGITSKISEAEE